MLTITAEDLSFEMRSICAIARPLGNTVGSGSSHLWPYLRARFQVLRVMYYHLTGKWWGSEIDHELLASLLTQ